MGKCLSVIFVLLAMLLAGCGTPETSPQPSPQGEGDACLALAEIDSLMWQRPDSAFALLQEFAASPEADSLDDFNIHYCQLLISELLYKNYYGQSNREGLLHAVDYLDSLTADAQGMFPQERNVFLDARAHYINGVGFYEQGDMVQACAEYLKTLGLMESRFGEKELTGKKARFMANTYNRLGDLFSEQFMIESSIACYEKALVYCKIEPTSPLGVSNILYRIGKQYDKKDEIDKARWYYEQALESMTATDNMVYRNIVASKALCDYKAEGEAKPAIDELNAILKQANTENERLNRYFTLGCVCFLDGNYDSALLYLEPVFEKREAGLQDRAANYLYSIYSRQGDRVKEDSLMHFLASRKKMDGEKKALVSELEGMYKDYLNQKQGKEAEEAREASIRKTVETIVPFAIMIAFAVFIVVKLRSKKLLEEQQEEAARMLEETEKEHEKELRLWQAEADKELEDKEKRHQKELEERDKRHTEAIKAERQTHRMEQAALSGRLKRKNQEVRELKDQIKQLGELSANTETTASFNDEPVCRLIMERVNEGHFKSKNHYKIYKDSALDKQQLLDLRLAADRHFGQFTVRLKKAYPGLTDRDLDYCCLYLLGLTDADVAALMQRAYNTVYERNGKMRKIFGSDSPLPITLTGMAKNPLSI